MFAEFKRKVSMLVVLAMLLSVMSMCVSAETAEDTAPAPTVEQVTPLPAETLPAEETQPVEET